MSNLSAPTVSEPTYDCATSVRNFCRAEARRALASFESQPWIHRARRLRASLCLLQIPSALRAAYRRCTALVPHDFSGRRADSGVFRGRRRRVSSRVGCPYAIGWPLCCLHGVDWHPPRRGYAARRSYRWRRPPTCGIATTRPAVGRATGRGRGASFSSARCVRDAV
jgi:hypothetical protein